VISNRIKRRAILFAAWLACCITFTATVTTVFQGVGYFGGGRHVLFRWGGVLIMDVPPGKAAGWVWANIANPVRRVVSVRFMGFYSMPKRYGTTFWIPLGLPLLILTTVVTLAYWRRLRHESGCRSCGYDLTGNVSGVCPECGAATRMAGRES